MRNRCLVFIGLFVAGCASSNGSGRPADVAQAEVAIHVANPPYFGSGTTAPLTLEATITNRANVPVTVRSIRYSSPNMVEYTIRTDERIINTTLQPGESKTFPLPATAFASRSRLSPSEPLNIRADIDFEVRGQRYREYFYARG